MRAPSMVPFRVLRLDLDFLTMIFLRIFLEAFGLPSCCEAAERGSRRARARRCVGVEEVQREVRAVGARICIYGSVRIKDGF